MKRSTSDSEELRWLDSKPGNNRAEIVNRMRSLSASSTGRWGSLERSGHVAPSSPVSAHDSGRTSNCLREQARLPDVSLKHLILYVLPFPKGAPTATELKPVAVASFEEERTALLELLSESGLALVTARDRTIRYLDH